MYYLALSEVGPVYPTMEAMLAVYIAFCLPRGQLGSQDLLVSTSPPEGYVKG